MSLSAVGNFSSPFMSAWGDVTPAAAAGKLNSGLSSASAGVGGLVSSPLTDLASLAEAASVKAVNLFGVPAKASTPAAPSGLGKLAASSATAVDNAATGFKWGGAVLAVVVGLALLHETKEAVTI